MVLGGLLAIGLFTAGCADSQGPSADRAADLELGTDQPGGGTGSTPTAQGAVVLVIDESSIDNDNRPNGFSEVDVNDHVAALGQRSPLPYFVRNVGRSITLYTGQVGDEGWFALPEAPRSWRQAGPTGSGVVNFLRAGPGLGRPNRSGDREALLDKIPGVTPLRATGLAMLIGQTVCAVVFDSGISINYSPLTGSLKGETLGIVGFVVERVTELTTESSSSLPAVRIRIEDPRAVCDGPLALFANAPRPRSSSEPFDVVPPASPPPIRLAPAN
jgi:hypothetical protein